MPSNIDRKIAVIFVADVVGYSKHIEKDEIKTLLKDVLNDECSNKTSLLLILYAALDTESGNLDEAKKLLARANKAGLKISRLQSWKDGEIYPLIKPNLDEIGYLNQ